MEPSAGVVLPSIGLLDREVDVVVTVESLKLDAPPTLDFGAGITVSDVQLASTSTVLAHLKVSPDALVGARDVTIVAASQTVTGIKAFKLLPPLDVKVSAGTAEQGNIVTVDLPREVNDRGDRANPAVAFLHVTDRFVRSLAQATSGELAARLDRPTTSAGRPAAAVRGAS